MNYMITILIIIEYYYYITVIDDWKSECII